MIVETTPPPKAPRRKPARAAERPAPAKIKATIGLSVEADRRLGVYAAMTGQDRSSVVEELIRVHLRRFVVSDRGGCDTVGDRQEMTAN